MVANIKRYIGIGKEATFGTAVAATRYVESVENLQPDPGHLVLEPIAQRARRDKVLTKFHLRGNIGPWEVRPEDIIGEALYGTLGAVQSFQQGGTAAYKHSIALADTIKSWTIRKGVELNELVNPGCLFNDLTLRCRHGGILNAVLGVVGVAAEPTKVALPALLYSAFSTDTQPWTYDMGTLKISDVDKSSLIYDVSVTIDNKIPLESGGHGSKYMDKIRVGDRVVRGTLSTFFDETSQYDAFLAGTQFWLNLKWVGAQIGSTGYYYTLELILPKCYYSSKAAPEIKQFKEPLVVDAPFDALYYAAGDDPEIEIYLTNAITSY